ncbi:MAG: hypothetical protein AAF804_14285, partial [Bacteroidota bacterium]
NAEGFGIKIQGADPFDFCLYAPSALPNEDTRARSFTGMPLYLGASKPEPNQGTTGEEEHNSPIQLESQPRTFSYEIQPLLPSNKGQ